MFESNWQFRERIKRERSVSQLLKWAETQGFVLEYEPCDMCHGKGKRYYSVYHDDRKCDSCNGTGTQLKK